jgi:hypothetical protein
LRGTAALPHSARQPDPRLDRQCFIVRDAAGQALAYVYFEGEPGRPSGGLIWPFRQDDAGMRVHVMYLMTYRTSHRLIDVVVFRDIFGNKALNAISGIWASVYNERHAEKPQARSRRSRP